jgi:hypothetical protein
MDQLLEEHICFWKKKVFEDIIRFWKNQSLFGSIDLFLEEYICFWKYGSDFGRMEPFLDE